MYALFIIVISLGLAGSAMAQMLLRTIAEHGDWTVKVRGSNNYEIQTIANPYSDGLPPAVLRVNCRGEAYMHFDRYIPRRGYEMDKLNTVKTMWTGSSKKKLVRYVYAFNMSGFWQLLYLVNFKDSEDKVVDFLKKKRRVTIEVDVSRPNGYDPRTIYYDFSLMGFTRANQARLAKGCKEIYK